MPERRFPPLWSLEELDACFVVRDSGVLTALMLSRHGCRI
jgi:hypothetical protein